MGNIINAIISLSLLFSNLFVSQPLSEPGPIKINDNSLGIELTAKAAIVRDRTSGAVLFSKNENEPLPIASITKLMTALVFLETNPDWEKVVTLSKEDYRNGNITYLISGEQATVKDLFNLMLVASANEAAIALAKSTGKSENEFVDKMNEKASRLGMTNTKFFDPAGLSSENISSAADISLLTAAALNEQVIKDGSILKNYQYRIINKKISRTAQSTNQLLNSFLNSQALDYQVVGGKTGYLNEALNCLTVEISHQNQKIIITILGSLTADKRWQEAKGLADWTYSNYQWPSYINPLSAKTSRLAR